MNLRISKAFSFDLRRGSARKAPANGKDEDESEKRYHVTLSVQAQNILNRTNLATPVGNLSSPVFGRSLSLAGGNPAAGNRRIEAQIGFSF